MTEPARFRTAIRSLTLAALLCGMAILVAFAVQVVIAT